MTACVGFGEIRDDDVGAGSHERRQDLVDGAIAIEPAVADRRLKHRVLAADVVNGNRHVKPVAGGANDVEIGQSRLDHHDVGALRNVKRDLTQRFARVGRVQLIATAISLPRCRTCRISKRPIERRCILRAVRHDGDARAAVAVQRATNRLDAAVHHIGWSDDVGSRIRVRQSDAAEQFQRRVVVDLALRIENPAVPMVGILAAAEVGHHEHLRQLRLEGANRPLHDSVAVVTARRSGVFVCWNAKEKYALDPQRKKLARFGYRALERKP